MMDGSQLTRTDQDRFPLSHPQELWCEQAEAGAFGPRFVVTRGFRITGHVEVPALRAALDDVVQRHELLRTIVVPDADPPYQQVYPPCPVPLEVRDLPSGPDRSRQLRAEELLSEAEAGSLDVLELPLLRAVLGRFDDEDSVLTVMSHHAACDGWSMQLILRDLAACYAGRLTGTAPALPPAFQYWEFAAWQRVHLQSAASAEAVEYWRRQLAGGGIFALPTDRPVPRQHRNPYTEVGFTVDAQVIAALGRQAKRTRCSTSMFMLATFNVLAHQLTGTTDPMIDTIIHGRGQPKFSNTVGPLMNLLPLRTPLDSCTSFRDVLLETRLSCLEAFSHELPLQHIEQAVPEIADPLKDPGNTNFIFGFFQSPFAPGTFQIGDGMAEIFTRHRTTSQNPGGAAWGMSVRPSGELVGRLEYSPDEFDESTVAGWVEGYCRLLKSAVTDPDRDWRGL